MAWVEWDRKNELLMKGIRMLHGGGRSDCIWAAFHRTAKMLAFPPKQVPQTDLFYLDLACFAPKTSSGGFPMVQPGRHGSAVDRTKSKLRLWIRSCRARSVSG